MGCISMNKYRTTLLTVHDDEQLSKTITWTLFETQQHNTTYCMHSKMKRKFNLQIMLIGAINDDL